MTQSSLPCSLTCRMHSGTTVHSGQNTSDRAMPRTCYERWGIGNSETAQRWVPHNPVAIAPPSLSPRFQATNHGAHGTLELTVLGNRKQPKKTSTSPLQRMTPHNQPTWTTTSPMYKQPRTATTPPPPPTNDERPRITMSPDPRRDKARPWPRDDIRDNNIFYDHRIIKVRESRGVRLVHSEYFTQGWLRMRVFISVSTCTVI